MAGAAYALADDRGCDTVTEFTSHQLVEKILQALKDAARDVDQRRVPLDGRVRLLPDEAATGKQPADSSSAES
jgi:hypothetical protein